MKIPLFCGKSLAEFVKSGSLEGERKVRNGQPWKVFGVREPIPAPGSCPQENCQAKEVLHRHGSYCRQIIEGLMCFLLLIYRFRCRHCGKTVSRPYSFLIPYKRFTSQLVAKAIETYGSLETTYQEVSVELSVYEPEGTESTVEPEGVVHDGCCPARSTVFAWVDFASKRITNWLQWIIRELVRCGQTAAIPPESGVSNPNAYKAGKDERYWQQKFKPKELNNLAYALSTGSLLLHCEMDIVQSLREYFCGSSERRLDLLSDVSQLLPTTHTSERRIS